MTRPVARPCAGSRFGLPLLGLLTACHSAPEPQPTPLAALAPTVRGPQIAVRVHGHPSTYADARTWRETIAARLAAHGLAAGNAHYDLPRAHDRLAALGRLPLRPPDLEPEAEVLLECQLVGQSQDTRPVKGFVLGPIRSNDHLVTARIALAIRLLHIRSQRQIVASEVDGLGQKTVTITELNLGNYDAQVVPSDEALQEAASRALDAVAERVASALATR